MIKIKSYGSGSSGNLYYLTTNKCKIVLECGKSTDEIKRMFNDNDITMNDIDCCITSHAHSDHSDSIKYFSDYMKPCYCTYDTKVKYNVDIACFKQLCDQDVISIKDLKIMPIIVNHQSCECYGFVLVDKDGCTLFVTDFMEMKQNLQNYKFSQIFIECNYVSSKLQSAIDKEEEEKEVFLAQKHSRQYNTHQSLENLVVHLSKLNLSNCDKITLIHISEEVGNRDYMKQTIEETFGIECVALKRNGEEY